MNYISSRPLGISAQNGPRPDWDAWVYGLKAAAMCACLARQFACLIPKQPMYALYVLKQLLVVPIAIALDVCVGFEF